MSSAAEVLVVILSIFLAMFLLLGIVLTVYLIRLTQQIRRISDSAGRTVESVETVVTGVAKVTSPVFVAKMVNQAIKNFTKSRKKNKKEEQ